MGKVITYAKKERVILLLAAPVVAFALFLGYGGTDFVSSVSAGSGDPIYMKIEGIDGEATDRGHEKEIDVLSWSWGMSQGGSGHAGGGAGKVSVHDLSLTKYVDKSSPDLMLACASGKHFPKIELTMRKPGEAAQDYLKYTFENVVCASYQVGGSSSDPIPTESISMNFTKVLVEYKEQKPGGSLGAPERAGWDFEKNMALTRSS